jgi:hypothetical protein
MVSTPSSEALPPAPPDPAPRPEAKSALPLPPSPLDPQAPVQALPPAPEVGPPSARPAIPDAPAGSPPREARETLSEPVPGSIRTRPGQGYPGASGAYPAPPATPASPHTAPLPLDLGAIGKPLAPSSIHDASQHQPARSLGASLQPRATTPSPSPAPAAPRCGFRRKHLGLDLAELASIVGATADPILAAELARRTASPPPPEPPPQTLPTVELFELLPGRHDLIMVTARRLCEETGDYKVATQRTFEKMAEAVATRAVPPSVLLDCWRQGMGPKSEHKGKVLVAAWKREAPLRC